MSSQTGDPPDQTETTREGSPSSESTVPEVTGSVEGQPSRPLEPVTQAAMAASPTEPMPDPGTPTSFIPVTSDDTMLDKALTASPSASSTLKIERSVTRSVSSRSGSTGSSEVSTPPDSNSPQSQRKALNKTKRKLDSGNPSKAQSSRNVKRKAVTLESDQTGNLPDADEICQKIEEAVGHEIMDSTALDVAHDLTPQVLERSNDSLTEHVQELDLAPPVLQNVGLQSVSSTLVDEQPLVTVASASTLGVITISSTDSALMESIGVSVDELTLAGCCGTPPTSCTICCRKTSC